MTNPSNLVITGIDGYFTLIFLQKSGYMLTLLYNAKEQRDLDISNQVNYDMYNWVSPTE